MNKTAKLIRKSLKASSPNLSPSQLKSAARLLRKEYSKVPRNQRFDAKKTLQKEIAT